MMTTKSSHRMSKSQSREGLVPDKHIQSDEMMMTTEEADAGIKIPKHVKISSKMPFDMQSLRQSKEFLERMKYM